MQRIRLAALVLAVGLLAAGVWAAAAVLDQIQRPADFVRTAVPGSVSVTLNQVGAHVVYFETRPAEASDRYSRPDSSLVTVTGPRGSDLQVRPYPAQLRYDYDGALGTAVAVFDTQRTGTHVVSMASSGAAGQMAVGDDLAPGLLTALLPPALTALASLVLAVLLVWAPTRRRPNRQLAHQ